MRNNSKFSYSFSFSKQTCNNLRYYKKTHDIDHKINTMSEKFILSYMENITETYIPPKRGRPLTHKKNKDMYIPFSFSFLKSTIQTIQKYKQSSNSSLDAALENYINMQIPVH